MDGGGRREGSPLSSDKLLESREGFRSTGDGCRKEVACVVLAKRR
jgi:hypothetical protein